MSPAYQQAAHLRALLLSASLGGGHQKAGEALTQALGELSPDFEAVHADYLSYLNTVERAFSAGIYLAWLKYSPASYRFFYDWTNRESEPRFITGTFGWAGLLGMARELRRARPKLVVSSYAAPATLAEVARARLGMQFLNALVVTDYSVHKHWARPEVDVFLVATEQAKAELMAWGIAETKVAVTGIPILPRYRELIGANKAELRRRFGLRADEPLMLVSAGAQGTYRALEEVCQAAASLGTRVQVLLLAGSQGPLGVERVGGATIHRLGYTEDFPELLAASDLVVGKAGGLTVAEALALGIPMLVYRPIPGQEEGNARYLEAQGAALWARSHWELRRDLLALLGEDSRRRAMSAAASRLGRPDAAFDAARVLLSKLGLPSFQEMSA